MINFTTYRKFVNLPNGKRVMLRFLNAQDRESLVQLFQEALEEDVSLLKQDVKDVELVNSWIEHLNYNRVLPLVAVDLEVNRLVAEALLHRGKHAARHIGDIRIFVSRPFRDLGLGGRMLDELFDLAGKLDFQILKTEVLSDHKSLLKAFRSRGFESKCTLADYFLRKDGVTHDVVLLLRSVIKKEEKEF